jgi:hypothetical protein
MTIGDLADTILATLNANKATLGINGAEYAERGKMQTVIGPAALLWLEPGNAQRAHAGVYGLTIGVHLFCVSSPAATQAAALDEAYTIALKVLDVLDGKTVTDIYCESDTDAIELVESGSNAAVIAVNLTTALNLSL